MTYTKKTDQTTQPKKKIDKSENEKDIQISSNSVNDAAVRKLLNQKEITGLQIGRILFLNICEMIEGKKQLYTYEEYIDLICNSPKYSLLVEFDDINKANKDWIYSHIDKNKYKTYITEEQIVNDLKKIFGDELNINIEEDQNLIPTNSASNIPKLVEKNKYFLTPMGDTINVMYAIDTIEKREKNYIVDVVEYGEDIDNENILDEKYAIYSYKNNNWNKTFNLEENQSGKDFIIIENILKNKSDYNMYQIVILQENNNLYVKKIQRK